VSGFNYLMLGFAGVAALLFVVLLVVLVRRTQGRGGFEPPDPQPAPVAAPAPAPPPAPVVVSKPPPIAPAPDAPPYATWRLVSRTIANPDSAGGPLFRLRFAPEGALPSWQAGAIARIYCGPAEEALVPGGTAAAPAGDYMIGSLPEDGAVDLVVRVRTNQNEEEGRRSHWLCEEARPGQQIALALRDDPGFAPPPGELPLILIGNATGIAGLEAHIKARAAGTRNWLIFGDRRSADDQVLAAAITDWVSIGHLERCDLVLPGDGPEQRRITDQLADAGETLLDWGLAGAAIYVCGSIPMGNDVHAALTMLLGPEVLEAMAEEGLYRRALY
jgi:sulfite reductase (NADPH) flavoprotein alpha-component